MKWQDCEERQQGGGWWEDVLADRCSFPIAPVNTWTNAAYLLAGAFVMWQTRSWAGAVEAGSLAVLGIGSALYHGLKTRLAGVCDDVGMYLVFSTMTVYCIAPHNPWTPAAMIIVGGALAAWRFVSEEADRYQHALLGTFTGAVAMADALNGEPVKALGAMALLLIAYLVCWQMDKRRTFPLPHWGHGLWHILTAAAIALLFIAR